MKKKLNDSVLKKAKDWINNKSVTAVLREEINDLIEEKDIEELTDRFYKDLAFGTAGIRGQVGAGTNRLNVFNIYKVTQGLSNYVKKLNIQNPSAVIGFDSRLSSVEFAKATAQVLATNNITVNFFDTTHATPVVSFAVRHLKTTLGIIITASHNPPEYNGYKIVWSNGCQVTSPHDIGIIQEVEALEPDFNIKIKSWQECLGEKMVSMIPPEVDKAYLDKVLKLVLSADDNEFKKGIIYTPLHGVGYEMVNELLNKRKFTNYRVVKSQMDPDGNFPTLRSPNPEDTSSMAEAIKTASENDHLIMATDPDADRLGVMVRHKDKWKALTGNQIGQILLYYWLNLLKQKNKLPKNGFVVSTLVTASLGKKITQSFGIKFHETLTGFKNIGKVIEENLAKNNEFLFAYEESHGYQFGDFIREKDGISACLMFAELFKSIDKKGQSIMDLLDEIYQKYGYHEDRLINKVIPGKFGAEKINKIMQSLRDTPPTSLAGVKVVTLNDYLTLTSKNLLEDSKNTLPENLKTNLISLILANGTRCSVRPSGTEPKIKFYFNFASDDPEEMSKYIKNCTEDFLAKIEKIIKD